MCMSIKTVLSMTIFALKSALIFVMHIPITCKSSKNFNLRNPGFDPS